MAKSAELMPSKVLYNIAVTSETNRERDASSSVVSRQVDLGNDVHDQALLLKERTQI